MRNVPFSGQAQNEKRVSFVPADSLTLPVLEPTCAEQLSIENSQLKIEDYASRLAALDGILKMT